MKEYYLKLKSNGTEIEFSTSDKTAFEENLKRLTDIAQSIEKDKAGMEKIKKQFKIDIQPERKTVTISNLMKPPQEKVLETDFEAILNKSMQNPVEQISPSHNIDQGLAAVLERKNINNIKDSLVATAYYLSETENAQRFSLKQINRKLFPIKNQVVDHAAVQELIKEGKIKKIPDLTGASSVKEYELTQEGEDYYHGTLR